MVDRLGKRAEELLRLVLDPTEADRDESWTRQQNLVATCLGRAGFEYRPEPIAASRLAEDIVSPASRRRFGYGIRADYTVSVEAAESPNERYLASLSPSRRAAYQATLVECSIAAASTMGLPDDLVRPLGTATLQDALEQAVDSYWDRAEVGRLVDTYREHMAAQGFVVTRYSHAAEIVSVDVDRLLTESAYRDAIFAEEERASAVDAACMELVYGSLLDIWRSHARQALIPVVAVLDR